MTHLNTLSYLKCIYSPYESNVFFILWQEYNIRNTVLILYSIIYIGLWLQTSDYDYMEDMSSCSRGIHLHRQQLYVANCASERLEFWWIVSTMNWRRPHRKHFFQYPFYCCVRVYRALPRNGFTLTIVWRVSPVRDGWHSETLRNAIAQQ
jgi:hypothetical protein